MKTIQLSARLFLAIGASAMINLHAADAGYHNLKEIPVGGAGKFDYLSVDPDAHRLYVTHGTKVVVIDTEKDAVVGEVTDTPGVHGFALAPELKRGFSSNGRENKVSIVDLDSLKTISKVPTGKNPDDILYEPSQQEVYAFNGGGSVTIFEAKTGKVVTTLPLPGKPEFSVADSKAGRIYGNIEDKSEIAVIEIKTHQIVAHWPIAPGESASGLAIDLDHHRLFAVCENKKMVMIDSTNGKVVTTIPIGSGTDAAGFDPETQLAFASNGEGTITIAHEDAPNKLTVVQTLKTQPGARTMALDPKTHKIYQAVGSDESFKVLVHGK
jgi:DNA-binding beta-propeller fold protein YncE